ncbi:sodium-dependent nutrient amino acid transporter 1 [Folsomia candida]|uniref:sodium-dependent nutrient amino acid transporter 1 n=1 Tax=Folsomia candida TaxID=158441 RepID=UPI0016053EA7|nr:sodium-dependent nutrient amino acid transporter 1 [Folsomia candida]XP_035710054.1 sodium-dependent nutrient amino acid transporter 1 [Folsomia candida]
MGSAHKKVGLSEVNNFQHLPLISVHQNDQKNCLKEASAEESPDPVSRNRAEWSNPVEFLFSCIALSVGLGNVWRFPFTAYKNGGGAFLLPYFVVLFLIGKPLYFMELSWGQFSSYGQVKAWGAVPLLKGVGYGELIASICGGSYYCAIMAITVYYLLQSFKSVLPWTVCADEWQECGENMTESIPELYLKKEVTMELENIENGVGVPELKLAICLFVVWTLVFLTVFKGIKSSGKASYFLAIFPYFVLVILLIRGLTLPGSWEGVWYFIKPQWDKILEPRVWYAAITQCLFSLSTGFGATIMNASYNSFTHNIYRDAFIINILDVFTSLLAGLTVFATCGNLAVELNVEISDVVKSGPGLAFISYPDAISKIKIVPQLHAILFFSMLLTLGIGTAISIANGIITVICDEFPGLKRLVVTSIVCLGGFSVGLIYVTPGGQFLITLVDYYGAGFVIFVMSTLEIIGIAWIYGVGNFCTDLEFMLNRKIGWFWKICWAFIIPVAFITILLYTLLTSTTLTHGGVPFPTIALMFGRGLAICAVSIVPIFAIQVIYKTPGSNLWKKFTNAIKPSSDWGPRNRKTRDDWLNYKLNKQTLNPAK